LSTGADGTARIQAPAQSVTVFTFAD